MLVVSICSFSCSLLSHNYVHFRIYQLQSKLYRDLRWVLICWLSVGHSRGQLHEEMRRNKWNVLCTDNTRCHFSIRRIEESLHDECQFFEDNDSNWCFLESITRRLSFCELLHLRDSPTSSHSCRLKMRSSVTWWRGNTENWGLSSHDTVRMFSRVTGTLGLRLIFAVTLRLKLPPEVSHINLDTVR